MKFYLFKSLECFRNFFMCHLQILKKDISEPKILKNPQMTLLPFFFLPKMPLNYAISHNCVKYTLRIIVQNIRMNRRIIAKNILCHIAKSRHFKLTTLPYFAKLLLFPSSFFACMLLFSLPLSLFISNPPSLFYF